MERTPIKDLVAAFEEEVDEREWRETMRRSIPPGKTKLVSVRLPESLYQAIVNYSDQHGISFSDVLRKGAHDFLSRRHSSEEDAAASDEKLFQTLRRSLMAALGRPEGRAPHTGAVDHIASGNTGGTSHTRSFGDLYFADLHTRFSADWETRMRCWTVLSAALHQKQKTRKWESSISTTLAAHSIATVD